VTYYHVRALHPLSAETLYRFNLDASEVEAQVVSHLRSDTSFLFQGSRIDSSQWSIVVWETPEQIYTTPEEVRSPKSPQQMTRDLWLKIVDVGGRDVTGELLYGTGRPLQTPGTELAADPERAQRIFVSHAGADAEIARKLVDLLRLGCNLPQEAIFFTSSPQYSPPIGADWARHIRERLGTTGLLVVLFSPAFLSRRYCLLELGAQWMTDLPWHPMLIPPTTATDVNELPQRPQARRIDDGSALDELRDKVIAHLAAQTSTAGWNEEREKFLSAVAPDIVAAEAAAERAAQLPQASAAPQRFMSRGRKESLIAMLLNCEAELRHASEQIEDGLPKGVLWTRTFAPDTEAWLQTEETFRTDLDLQDCYLPVRAAYEDVNYLRYMADDTEKVELGAAPFSRAQATVAEARAALAERRAVVAAFDVDE
jgi:TIR domain